MYTQTFRLIFIFTFALLTHAIFNITPNFGLSKEIQYPLIIGLTPYIVSKLPLLGTRNLMIQGVQPLVSMTFLIICTIVVHFIIKQIERTNQMDFLSKYIKEKKQLRIEGFELKRDFIIVLIVVMLCEVIFQGIVAKNEYAKIEKALYRTLEKYHGRKG